MWGASGKASSLGDDVDCEFENVWISLFFGGVGVGRGNAQRERIGSGSRETELCVGGEGGAQRERTVERENWQ